MLKLQNLYSGAQVVGIFKNLVQRNKILLNQYVEYTAMRIPLNISTASLPPSQNAYLKIVKKCLLRCCGQRPDTSIRRKHTNPVLSVVHCTCTVTLGTEDVGINTTEL